MRTALNRLALVLAACPLATACVGGGGEPPPPTPLVSDRGQPVLALFEHVLTGYFAAAGPSGPTTCPELLPDPLSDEQEQALIERFVRLAPLERCTGIGAGRRDAITGEPAQVVQVYEFACPTPGLCSGWVAAPDTPVTRYAMRYEGDAWRFDPDRRLLAE